MKILYGITKSNFGGAQRYVFDLATAMKRGGHDVVVLCGEGNLVDKFISEKIRVLALDNLQRDISIMKEIKSFFQILRILKKERPDVFHVNSSKMGGLGTLAGRLTGVKKVVFTIHGWAFSELRPWWQKVFIKFFSWLTILFSHKSICISEAMLNRASQWPFIKNKLVVIYNGISGFNLTKRKDQSFTVGAISELHKIKGLDILLTAWSKFIKNPARTTVQSGGHQARLVIIGEGEERQNLENMAQTLGISGSVVFKGFVEDARTQLLNFDIFCMPSRSEAMPYALLEAGLAGLAVIATPVGGVPEVIESGINGVLIPVEDADTLFSTLILLAEDKDLRKRLGANLKASIKENFSFEKMAKETFALY
ncbi:MAG: glycosyltransferase family 4 protein [bacterium]|nr:glycosyltransferase family 4 protein [bacterium]